MIRLTTLITATLSLSSLGLADVIVFDTPPNTDLGVTHTYTTPIPVTATAFNGGDLFSKDLGIGEQGLGLTGDPSTQNEIFFPGTDFVQLDLSTAIADGFKGFQFRMNSVTKSDAWSVVACSGPGGTGTCSTPVAGADEALHNAPASLSGSMPFLDFSATDGNVLLSSLTASAVPEPRFYGLLLAGILGIVGVVIRSHRAATRRV